MCCTINEDHMIYGSRNIRRNATDRTFCHLEPFFAFSARDDPENQNFEKLKNITGDIIILHMCTINNNHMMYVSWDMEHERKFLSFWTVFALLPPNNPENQNFEKRKKKPGDIIILQMCTINHNMECDKQDFLSFLAIFCPFTPLTLRKIKILKKRKKPPRDIIILHKCTIKDNHMMYGS